MRYYDSINDKILTETDIEKSGLTKEGLEGKQIFEIEEILPDIDKYHSLNPGTKIEKREGKYVCEWYVIPQPISFIKAAKLEDLANIRWEHQTMGVQCCNGSIFISTEPSEVDKLSATLQGMLISGINEISYKAPMEFVYLTIDSLKEVIKTVNEYVQKCFSNEHRLVKMINECNDERELLNLDLEDGWPE